VVIQRFIIMGGVFKSTLTVVLLLYRSMPLLLLEMATSEAEGGRTYMASKIAAMP
jgi:hypothetical protein